MFSMFDYVCVHLSYMLADISVCACICLHTRRSMQMEEHDPDLAGLAGLSLAIVHVTAYSTVNDLSLFSLFSTCSIKTESDGL